MRAEALTPIDLLEQCLARIDRYELLVRAWVVVDRDRARVQAMCSVLMHRAPRGSSALHVEPGVGLGVCGRAVIASDDLRAAEARIRVVLDGTAPRRLTEVDLPADGDLLLVVGPEGGITETEAKALTSAGALPVRLGPT